MISLSNYYSTSLITVIEDCESTFGFNNLDFSTDSNAKRWHIAVNK